MICLFHFYPEDSVGLGTEEEAQTAKHFKEPPDQKCLERTEIQISFLNAGRVSLLGVCKLV